MKRKCKENKMKFQIFNEVILINSTLYFPKIHEAGYFFYKITTVICKSKYEELIKNK